jgi:hypothetical protein
MSYGYRGTDRLLSHSTLRYLEQRDPESGRGRISYTFRGQTDCTDVESSEDIY